MGLLDAANRGIVGGLLSAPVDLVNLAVQAEKPIGGSEWRGDQMQRAGIVGPERNPMAELALGLLGPGTALGTAARLGKLRKFTPETGSARGLLDDKITGQYASKSANIYDPNPLPQRPFHADYPQASPSDGGRRLETDIDGRPLSASAFIAGRRIGGSADLGSSNSDVDRVAHLLGVQKRFAPRSDHDLAGNSGRYIRADGDRRIVIDQNLEKAPGDRVFAHETGHAIDDLAQYGSGIPTKGLSKELKRVYEDLNTGTWFKPGRGMTPQGMGYKHPDDVERELMAEAIRAYMRDPNYLKTVAPKTAARIREYVNPNPNLNKVIQFNSVGAGTVEAGLLNDDS